MRLMRILEFAYVLRRVELHHRELREEESPWSIRQTAIYHKYDPAAKIRSLFIVISPSQSGEQMLAQSLEMATTDSRAADPFAIHRLLIADSLMNWQDYIASLETQLRDLVQSCSVLSPVKFNN